MVAVKNTDSNETVSCAAAAAAAAAVVQGGTGGTGEQRRLRERNYDFEMFGFCLELKLN